MGRLEGLGDLCACRTHEFSTLDRTLLPAIVGAMHVWTILRVDLLLAEDPVLYFSHSCASLSRLRIVNPQAVSRRSLFSARHDKLVLFLILASTHDGFLELGGH